MADRGIGDNGGPKLEKFTAAKKIDRIREVLEMDITAHQKCVGVGIIVEADTDGIAAELSTKRLQTFASVSDRETVYRATKVLKEEQVAEAIKVKGKPNSYRVLPSSVVDAIVDAYNHAKDEAIYADTSSPLKPDIGVGRNPTAPLTRAVGLEPTCTVEPVGSDRTTAQSFPHTPFKENNNKNTNNNNKLASSEYGVTPALAGLNGSADPMISDIVGWMTGGDRQSAKNWLSTFLGQYAQDVVRESYFDLKTQIAEGKLIAQPLRVWAKIAARLKAEPKSRTGEAKISKSEERRAYAERKAEEFAAQRAGRKS